MGTRGAPRAAGYVASPEELLRCSTAGSCWAHDARTGREIYGRQPLAPDTSGFTASPWAYNAKIFAASEDGDTFVIQAGADYKVLGRHSLGEMVMASPAIARGSLVLRTASTLYRISETAGR